MPRPDPNRQMLKLVAEQLGPLRQQVVFLGGTTVGLLLSDPAARPPRPTRDVDVIIHVDSFVEYQTSLRDRLVQAGFVEANEPGAPICAWKTRGVRVDVMPTDATVLGFTNRWYGSALAHATRLDLDGTEIAVIDAPHFVATKLEAFRGRGNADLYASHDLEDIVAVVDGRAELGEEVESAPQDVRSFIQAEFRALLSDRDFINALPGHVPDADREPIVVQRWRRIAEQNHGNP